MFIHLRYADLLQDIDNYNTELYSMDKINRCRAVIKIQLRKFEGIVWEKQ